MLIVRTFIWPKQPYMSLKELIIMSTPKKQRFLKLMRMDRILPSDIYRENLSAAPKELLSQLSFSEFTQFVEELKTNRARV